MGTLAVPKAFTTMSTASQYGGLITLHSLRREPHSCPPRTSNTSFAPLPCPASHLRTQSVLWSLRVTRAHTRAYKGSEPTIGIGLGYRVSSVGCMMVFGLSPSRGAKIGVNVGGAGGKYGRKGGRVWGLITEDIQMKEGLNIILKAYTTQE